MNRGGTARSNHGGSLSPPAAALPSTTMPEPNDAPVWGMPSSRTVYAEPLPQGVRIPRMNTFWAPCVHYPLWGPGPSLPKRRRPCGEHGYHRACMEGGCKLLAPCGGLGGWEGPCTRCWVPPPDLDPDQTEHLKSDVSQRSNQPLTFDPQTGCCFKAKSC